MSKIKEFNFKTLLPHVKKDKFWEKYIQCQILNRSAARLHLAIFVEPFLQYILDGQKTIESRFSSKRIIPYMAVNKGDVVLLKKSSGPILGICHVNDVWYYKLNESSWFQIKKEYSEALCAQNPEFWQDRKSASYATLIRIEKVKSLSPIHISKNDRRGWVIL